MLDILRLLASLLRIIVAQVSRRVAVLAVLWALAGLFALIGFLGFSAAIWIWLVRRLDPMSAALIIGVAGFVLALIAVLIARRKGRTKSLFSSPATAELYAALAAKEGNFAVWAPLIGLALLGFLAGSKPKD